MKNNIEVSKSVSGEPNSIKGSTRRALLFGAVLAAALSLAPHAPVVFPAAHIAQQGAQAMPCTGYTCKR